MLILSRKIGESIQIGEGVRVFVSRIGRGSVTIGIDAPRDVAIRRSELRPLDRSFGQDKQDSQDSKPVHPRNPVEQRREAA